MSENEDKYHDTILDLEEKLKKNVDLFLKIGAIRAENQNLLGTTSELKARLKNGENASKSKIDGSKCIKARDKVVQIVLWVVDSGCSKHMTGDRSLLRNFVEKFMGTVLFGNDNFAAITGYGDYIHGNITICH
ncbi:hypothetical protein Tco_0758446 [Tanacetum coccineum]